MPGELRRLHLQRYVSEIKIRENEKVKNSRRNVIFCISLAFYFLKW